MTEDLGFIHKYIPAGDAEAGRLFHLPRHWRGRGEPLPVASIIRRGRRRKPRGKVLENGMPRFRRLARGYSTSKTFT
ncbi:MAG: hypothetical protein R3B51_07175 [Thermodesulfobacteriota bacterium]